MKFEEENSVEILKGKEGGSELWFPGSIISQVGEYYVVKYEFGDSLGEPAIEKVKKEDVRPVPPYRRRKRWMVGDVAQVFDIRCWRLGKIVKVLKKTVFVIRLFGSIQLKEFHESSLRIWQVWHQNKWSLVPKNKAQFCGSLVYSSKLEVKRRDSCSRKRDMQKYLNVNKCLPVRMENRSNIDCLERSSKDMLSCVATHKLENCSRLVLIEDSDQCSVASCSSSNNPVDSTHRNNYKKAFADSSGNSDAESSCPSFEEKLEADIHELEFHAYKLTVQALYALGPLSWEQESLLTNLRLSLHISDEEHLLQLRHLLST
ncbi:uncharacterized protein [Euphorbia lathyris]|uniref:uncharacterized protein n=1 Tax=Euphorbia lathyris TaxID=212925 RepID=UPI00331394AE